MGFVSINLARLPTRRSLVKIKTAASRSNHNRTYTVVARLPEGIMAGELLEIAIVTCQQQSSAAFI